MEVLPLEIWSLVAGKTYCAGHNKTLKAMCLVSRGFCDIATPWLYRHVVFDGKQSQRLAHTIMKKDRAKYVQRIDVPEGNAVFNKFLVDAITDLLPFLRVLGYFAWQNSIQIDERLVKGLMGAQNLSHLELMYKVGLTLGQQMIPISVTEYTKLKRLELQVDWDRIRGGNPNEQQCKVLIAMAPNLAFLKITMIPSHQGAPTANAVREPAFLFKPGLAIPPLEALRLEKYCVGMNRDDELECRLQVAHLRRIIIRATPRSNVAVFLKSLMRKGQLYLNIVDLGASNLPDMLSSEWLTVLRAFLLSFKGLTGLCLRGWIAPEFQVIQCAIQHHNDTLKSLGMVLPLSAYATNTYHDTETDFRKLRDISSACPQLETLAADLMLGSSHEGLSGLRSVISSSLKELILVTPVSGSPDWPSEPYIDFDYIRALASHALAPRLEKITVDVGPSALPPFSEYLTAEQQWCHFNHAVWKVSWTRVSENDKQIHISETVHSQLLADLKRYAEASGSAEFNPALAWETYKEWRKNRGESIRRFNVR